MDFIRTVKASNFAPRGNAALFFLSERLPNIKRVLQKNNEDDSL